MVIEAIGAIAARSCGAGARPVAVSIRSTELTARTHLIVEIGSLKRKRRTGARLYSVVWNLVNEGTTPRSLLEQPSDNGKPLAKQLVRRHFARQGRGADVMGIRFAFDLGTNSLGFAIWRTGPDPSGVFGDDAPLELLWSGVRLFKDGRNPKDQQSLATMRRIPKQARKRRDRFVLRRADLMAALVAAGLMPSDGSSEKRSRPLTLTRCAPPRWTER